MASWMVHLRIADKLLDLVPETASTEFVVGNIAPDSGRPSEDGKTFIPSREVSHFNTNDQYGIKEIHEERFIEKYYSPKQRKSYDEKQEAFYLGYIVHLLTDKLWVKNVTHPTREKFSDLFEENEGEFWRGIKADWYDLDTMYLKKNPNFRAFHIYEEAVGFKNRYLDFYSEDALDLRRKDIVGFYRRECNLADRDFNYYTEKEMADFVEKASAEIREEIEKYIMA